MKDLGGQQFGQVYVKFQFQTIHANTKCAVLRAGPKNSQGSPRESELCGGCKHRGSIPSKWSIGSTGTPIKLKHGKIELLARQTIKFPSCTLRYHLRHPTPAGKFSIPPGVRTHWPRNVRPRGLLSVRPLVPPWERTGVDE